MLAIYKKELRAYFNTVIGWLFIAFFLAFVGVYVFLYNLLERFAFIGYALQSVSLIFCLLVPMVTMRIMAEENRQKTDQLLLTSPVSIWKIVLGKYLALVTLIGIAMLAICAYPIVFLQFGHVNLLMSYTAIFGFFLAGCTYLAIGLFISALSESQVFAAVMTFIIVLITSIAEGVASIIPSTAKAAWITYSVIWVCISVWIFRVLKNATISFTIFALGEIALTLVYLFKGTLIEGTIPAVFGSISLMKMFTNTTSGIFELKMPVYYISIAFVFCFLTYQSIRKRRFV